MSHARLGPGRSRRQVARLSMEQAEARLELELQRLGRLTGEPELAALGVETDALARHGRNRRLQQLLERNDREPGDELLGVPVDEDDKAAEPRRSRVLDQLEPPRGRLRDDRRRSMAECRRDGPLGPGLDVDHAQRQPLAPFGQRPRRR